MSNYQNIELMIKENDFENALNEIDKLISKYTNDSELYYLKSKVYYAKNDYQKAEYLVVHALFLNKTVEKYNFLLAEIKLGNNEIDEAQKIIESFNLSSSKEINALVHLSNILLKTNRAEDALKLVERNIKLQGENHEFLRVLANIQFHSNFPLNTVINNLKRAKSIGGDETTDYEIAKIHYLNGDFEESNTICKKCIALNPNSKYAPKYKELMQKNIRTNSSKTKVEKVISFSQNPDKDLDTNRAQSIEAAVEKLDKLIGLENVKHQIGSIIKQIEFEKQRNEMLGITSYDKKAYHFMFTGNPGTGKTTVARLIGDILHRLNILKSGHIVEVDRSSIVGQYIGQTAILAKEALTKAHGGVLFIDEAYSLAKLDSSNDFGKEAIEVILKTMEDERGNLTIILAGYTNEMINLINLNPGLKSRINIEINFPNYTDSELLIIAEEIAKKNHYKMNNDSKQAFLERINREKVDDHFANARTTRNIMEEAFREKAYRLSGKNLSIEEVSTLEPLDFGVTEFKSKKEMMDSSIKELEKMIGINGVKSKIYQIRDFVEISIKRNEAGYKSNPLVLHMQYVGNPGTGKTTVARIVGNILKASGVLKKGHMVEASRADLVAQYVGQTAIKTTEIVKRAYGGVLFIDEAYALASGGENDFGKEAITTLIKEMEDNKDKLVVIFAGYPKEMEQLMNANPGLKDRIMYTVEFPDYNADELLEIFKKTCARNDYLLDDGIENILLDYFADLYKTRDNNFGNGRMIMKLFESIKLRQAQRVIKDNLDGEDLRSLMVEDIKQCE